MKANLLCSITLSAVILLTGCSAGEGAPTPMASPSQYAASPQQKSLELNGSVAALPLMQGLAEGLTDYNGLLCNVTAAGKNAAFASLADFTADLAMFEGDSADIPVGATGSPVAYQAVAVIANTSCGVSDLTAEQLTSIFSGQLTDWSELGGSGTVTLVVPEEKDVFRQFFEDLFSLRAPINGIKKSIIPETAVVSPKMEQDVAGTPGAIGICPAASLSGNVVTVSIGGVLPTAEALNDGSYPAGQTMILVMRGGASEEMKKFYSYCTSKEAANTILASGYIPYQ